MNECLKEGPMCREGEADSLKWLACSGWCCEYGLKENVYRNSHIDMLSNIYWAYQGCPTTFPSGNGESPLAKDSWTGV